VSENRALRSIFGPKRDEITQEYRKLHTEELNDLYSSPNIVRVIKSRRMRWAEHVSRMGEERPIQGFGAESSEKDPGIDGTIILRWILESGMWDMDWIDLAQDRDR